ncbi:FadR/GntR family transcriptional regulator [Aliiruegeria lutimaris]|uniref:Transcriptional regulator, GntR family n=1 Tax=Aliiruegeria lutimaris TaxID=571298 RepID=A0A1G8Z871_9RHOB|nr:FCD domain-containing protein [Aliiruegeria lutimaris]SDK11272.1 transcriptional regulator, GntR family [Aliiruegeria lutimaris]
MTQPGSVNRDLPLGPQIADALGLEILSGIYRPGDVLPTEMELVERFGVSRASVRSGLQALAARGIVERFVGQGTIAQDFSDWNILDPAVTGMLADHESPHPDLVRSIFEFRFSAEPLIAAAAARKARARDLLALEEAMEGMERCAAASATGSDSFTQHDVSFHVAVYQATHNAIWSHLAHILRPAITLVVRRSNESSEELREALGLHRALMECIRMRDPAGAYNAAHKVMQLTAEELGIDPQIIGAPAHLPH